MKTFTKKSIMQKIIITAIIILLFNFTFPIYSKAFGGLLLEPTLDLFITLGDTVLSLLQNFLYDNGGADGIMNIALGNAYFEAAQLLGVYPEMDFHSNEDDNTDKYAEVVEITAKDFFGDTPIKSAIESLLAPTFITNIVTSVAQGSSIFEVPIRQYTIDKIFAGKIPAFDINFINPDSSRYKTPNWANRITGIDVESKIITKSLKDVISSCYVALRNLAIVGSLCTLVYIAIRMIISSATDKSKYKQMFFDWIVALCLIFCLHYIMAFTISFVEQLSDTMTGGEIYNPIPVKVLNLKFNTDLMGLCRLKSQCLDTTTRVTYSIMYLALIIYTIKFTWVYMKRTMTMIFLTMMAPLVALTYPIDKLNDGKAQAFNAWIKEYIFTALMQPFHLLLYTILLGSAMQIAVSNPIYAIMVLAFIGPAETMLRKFFGFDKASTPGTLSKAGALFGGAAMWNMTKKGISAIAGKDKSNGGNGKIRTANRKYADKNTANPFEIFGSGLLDDSQGGGNPIPPGPQQTPPQQTPPQQTPPQQTPPQQTPPQQTPPQQTPPQQTPPQQTPPQQTPPQQTPPQQTPPQQTPPQQTPPQQTPRPIPTLGKVLKGVGKGGKQYLHDLAYKKWGTPEARERTATELGKKALKLAGGLAVTTAIAGLSLPAAMAADELDDIPKTLGAAVALGASVAPALDNRIKNSEFGQAISESIGTEIYGSANEAKKHEQIEALRESGQPRDFAIEYTRDENGNRASEEKIEEAEERYYDCYNDEITDEADIKKTMKYEDRLLNKPEYASLPEQERKEKAKKLSHAVARAVSDMKIEPGKLKDERYRKYKIEEAASRIRKASNVTIDPADANKLGEQTMEKIDEFYGIK